MVHKRDEIVVTGVSCRLPESDNIEEFKENLMNKVDMITEDDRRWTPGYFNLPKRHGKVKELNKFDAAFFGVNPKQANMMDPQLRLLLEVAYEAILDAGLDPQNMRGTRTGVFVGCSSTETQDVLIRDPETTQGYSLTGCQHSMFANRLSFTFDFRGPSFAVDTACSSSLLAFQLANDAIKNGSCEAALVCGTQLTLRPTAAMQFLKLGMLSPQGKCQTFDANGDGYVRSEGVVAVLLQKESDAHRLYAEVVHAKSNTDGYKEQGITFPNGDRQAELLKEIYSEAGVDPNQVFYVECHGTGTKVGDPQETNAVTEVFCQNRKTPLLVGSVKSNMGHAEPASGLASICKILIAAQTGNIAPNLHYNEPNPNIPGLMDNRLKVVTEITPIESGLIGVNSFGFGGANTHILLKLPSKYNSLANHVNTSTPQLFTYGGRTHEAVEAAFNFLQGNSFDENLFALMSEHSLRPPTSYPYRGFLMYNRENNLEPMREIQKIPTTEPRPIWFIYSGMGTHYSGMGRELMKIEIFKETIQKCSNVLKPFDVDPNELILNGGSDGIWCAVCICAIQIALTETLKFLGIEPDGIIGHSFGEMAAAYGDGCMTLEETILCAYYRTKSILEGKFPPGAMAAVGLTWEEAKSRCPDGIIVACHNAKDSVTISGIKNKVTEFVEKLQEEGIFAKEVNSAGIAFHSQCMQGVAKPMKEYLSKIIPKPKQRSQKWISSSIPQDEWNTELGMYCSPEYHVNNAISPVLFFEALQHVPNHAVLIEISPHCLLQAILRRCASSGCANVGLLKARHDNNMEFFMQSLGKIYEMGLPINLRKLYPTVNYPISRGTPMISPIMKWDHSQDWNVISLKDMTMSGGSNKATTNSVIVDAFAKDSEDNFMLDHIIDGRILYPFAGHVVLAWKTLCKLRGLDFQTTPVVIEDMKVYRATLISHQPVQLDIILSTATGSFEILESDQVAAAGKISVPDQSLHANLCSSKKNSLEENKIKLTGNEIYKGLRLRGYEYGPSFRPIIKASEDGRQTEISWSSNWVTFIDALLQAILLCEREETLKLPVRIRYLAIDPERHLKCVEKNESGANVAYTVTNPTVNQCVAGGITLRDLTAQSVARRTLTNGKLILESVHFVQHHDDSCFADYPKMRKEIVQYQNLCLAMIRNITKQIIEAGIKLPNAAALADVANCSSTLSVDNNALQEIMEKHDSHLVRVLHKITETNFKDKQGLKELSTILEEGFKNLDQDKLWRFGYHERMVKPLLDTIMENCTGHRLKGCVIEPESCASAKLCKDMQNSQPLLVSDWTLIGPKVDQFDAFQISQHDFKVLKVDFHSADKVLEEQYTRYFDIVLLDKVLHKKADITSYLDKVKELVHDEGFIVVSEFTDCFEIPLTLLALQCELPVSQKNGARKYGVFYDNENWLKLFEKCGFVVVSHQGHGLMNTMYLLRKVIESSQANVQVNVDDIKEFSWLQSVQTAVEKDEGNKLWLTAERAVENGAVGLGLCLKSEVSKNVIRTVVNGSLKDETGSEMKFQDLKKVFESDLHSNVYRDGVWGSFRHLPLKDDQTVSYIETEHAFINTLIPGDLNSLSWVEGSNVFWKPSTNDTSKSLCNVTFAALNFRDIMLATGRLSGDAIPGEFTDRDCLLGMEYSGHWADNGKTVMGLSPAQALATTVIANKRFTWPVPDKWTLEQAATVPVAYTTAYYSLVVRGRIKRGDKVLIHGGSGGVGQAAIAVALASGCEVFTTTSSEEKKNYLQTRFPQLKEQHFSSSRNIDFEQHIMESTDGRGVDVVLNSLSEDKLQASVRCLAQHGRFLEIGKFDLSNNSNLGMSMFLKNVTFHGILLDALFSENNSEWLEIRQLFDDGIRSGVVQPLDTTVFPTNKLTEAFRFMAQGKHIGKVLLKIRPEEKNEIQAKSLLTVRAVSRTLCNPQHSYIITGGLGGFGLELTKWLIKRGAKKIILTSRTGVRSGYQHRCLNTWFKSGVKVVVSTADISNESGVEELFKEAQTLGPVGGLFHLAMVLRDSLFENQTVQNFKESADAKYLGTKRLDEITRRMGTSDLKFFVVFSSISCGRGNAGQTNYGWSNSIMERIVEKRRADGYPGIAIQWGAIGDVGVVLENMGDNSTIIGGTWPQRIPSCMHTLDMFLTLNHPIVSSFLKAEISSPNKNESSTDAVQSIAQILGVSDISAINHDSQLGDLGLDSLMGVEIKQTLERSFSLVLSAKEIRTLTLNKLRDMVKQK